MLSDRPQDPTLLYALGLLSAQSDDLAEAERYLRAYLVAIAAKSDDERDSSSALLLLAQIAEERKDTPAALKWLEQIGADSPQAYMNALLKRAQLISKAGDLAAARRLLKQYPAEGEAEKIQLVSAEAQLLRDAGKLGEAMSAMDTVLKRYPDNTDLLYDYAMLAEKADKLEVMETALRRIIKLAPNNQHAYNALGYSFAERNVRLQEAYTLIAKALELAPEDPFIIDSMGWVQYRLGRLKEAEASLQRAYKLRPDPEIAAHLGEVLWFKGEQEEAKKLWRDASKKNPKNDTLRNTLARLQVNL
jgi:tetratricopeptide (TPR) repeat protein